ncbi:MAG: hypothetical protein KIS78_29635 [Labilithrix sp.]|nr:hypothetical protein [Labilithrix sp.]MCW5836596.1 hypothetical protein [Labilithrix sp.]
MGVRGAVTVACGAGALAACTLFTDLSGFADPSLEGLPEAGEPIPDAAEEEAAPPADAAADAAADRCPDGGFCESFDDDLFAARWDDVLRTGGLANLDALDFVSPPRSLRATTVAGGAPNPKTGYLERVLTPTPAGVRCAFSIRVNAALDGTASGWIDVFQLVGTSPGVERFEQKLAMRRQQTGVRIDVTPGDGGACLCPADGAEIERSFPVGVWTRVVYATDFESVEVRYDDDVVLSVPFRGRVPSTLRLAFGLKDYSTVGGSDVSYDDLVCTFTY